MTGRRAGRCRRCARRSMVTGRPSGPATRCTSSSSAREAPMDPDRLRELAADLDRYQALSDPDDRASWERVIAVELLAELAPHQPAGWVLVREADVRELQRWEPWGRALRLLILPLLAGVLVGLGLAHTVGAPWNVVIVVIPAIAYCLWELLGPPATERKRTLARLREFI